MNKFRPPVVTLMGHIDHGKTTLLDKIRQTNTWNKEAGGITQHVSSYQVEVKPDQKITFIDTPGHAAFKKMRQRGGLATDIVVLVVSATDGVMAQTKECISIIKEFDLPVIVAINKIDLSSALVDKVLGQLSENELQPESFGGQISCIPVSAKSGQAIDKLIDTILITSQVLELENLPDSPLQAYIIESRIDKSKGAIATAIVNTGTISVGQDIFVGQVTTKVKALFDYTNKAISQALPSTPVQILGFVDIPPIGEKITDTVQKETSTKAATRIEQTSDPKIPIIVKADTQGTLEALLNSLSDEVKIISASVGPVLDNDIFLASASNAQIFAFNITSLNSVKALAKAEGVSIVETKIIYEILEEIEKQVLKILEPTIDETITGQGEIIAEFKIDKVRIAGLKCTQGIIKKGDTVHLKRKDLIIKDTKVDNIRQAKVDMDQVKQGLDCGITFKPYVDFKMGDVIISYKKEK